MNIELLKAIAIATAQPPGFATILGDTDARQLADAHLIEVNPSVPGLQAGHVAARTTEAGNRAIADHENANTGNAQGFGNVSPFGNMTTDAGAASNASAPVDFVPVANFTPPARSETAKREVPEKYPFGKLEAPRDLGNGQFDYSRSTIFVPSNKHTKGDKKGQLRTPDEMAFSLMSACSAAERRYATVTGTKEGKGGRKTNVYAKSREFKSVPYTLDGTPGAVIYRSV